MIAAAPVASIAETIRRLQSISLEDDLDTTVPPAARPLLVQLKHQLRDLVLATLNDPPQRSASPGPLRSMILAKLEQSGIRVGDQGMPAAYGSIKDINIERPAKHKDLLALTVNLSIVCAGDTSLYILKYSHNRWNLALALEAIDYAEINGAQGSFHYALSAPDRQNEFFIVAVDISPWCSSCWMSIRYKVLRLGPQAYKPKILMSRTAAVYRCNEEAIRLAATAKGFTLTYEGKDNRLQMEKYTVKGVKVTRVR